MISNGSIFRLLKSAQMDLLPLLETGDVNLLVENNNGVSGLEVILAWPHLPFDLVQRAIQIAKNGNRSIQYSLSGKI